MASKNKKFSFAVDKFTESINNFIDITKDPEFLRYIAHEIGRVAVRLAKENIKNADQKYEAHSEWTESMTQKFSKGARETKNLLDETGEMHDSIKIISSTVSYGRVIVDVGIKDPDRAKIAEILEYGAVFISNNGTLITIPKRPFLQPAVREAIDVAFSETNLPQMIDLAIQAKMAGKDWKKYFKEVRSILT